MFLISSQKGILKHFLKMCQILHAGTHMCIHFSYKSHHLDLIHVWVNFQIRYFCAIKWLILLWHVKVVYLMLYKDTDPLMVNVGQFRIKDNRERNKGVFGPHIWSFTSEYHSVAERQTFWLKSHVLGIIR